MASNNQNNPVSICVTISAAATGDVHPVAYLQKKFVLTACRLINEDAIAADNTNYVTLVLKNGSTTLATLDTRAANQGAVTALVAKAFSLASADAELSSGVTLSLAYTEGGSGSVSNAVVQVDGYWL